VFVGYGMNVLVVPALAFAHSWQLAALLVAAERTGKALRGPARDVLLSEATQEVGHGFGFGIHAAMDQTGAVLGPLLMAWMVLRSQRFGPAFLSLVIPALFTVAALVVARAVHPSKGTPPRPPKLPEHLPGMFRTYVIASGLLAAGFIDFPLLAYHFQRTGVVAPEVIPLLYAAAMGMTGASALLFGKLFDRYGLVILVIGTIIALLTLPFGFLLGMPGAIGAALCWGIGLGAQDATLRAGIAQVVSMNKRGSAFGTFNAVYGVMWFAGSALMGVLYDRSPALLVAFGVTMQLVAAIMFLALRAPLAAAAKDAHAA
jgi:MFS family permease